MGRIFKQFKALYIILGIILAVLSIALLRRGNNGKYHSSSDAITNQRVFDYADKLTSKQEEELENLIDKRQRQTGYDIVLVTLDMDVSNYDAINRSGIFKADYNDIMWKNGGTYASDFYWNAMDRDYGYEDLYNFQRAFWDEYRFGFDGHEVGRTDEGKGVIFVDNWYDEKTWFGTSGDSKLINFYEKDEAEASWHMLDLVGDQVVISPYMAYKTYVETFYYDMTGWIEFNTYISIEWPLVGALVIAIIMLIIKNAKTKPRDTTTSRTYVHGGAPVVNACSDVFVNKVVTRRTISSGSSGGGGGHSGGGHGGHGGHGGGH